MHQVSLITAHQNGYWSVASFPLMPKWSPMSCTHLCAGLPLPPLPGISPSITALYKPMCHLTWPKYSVSRWLFQLTWPKCFSFQTNVLFISLVSPTFNVFQDVIEKYLHLYWNTLLEVLTFGDTSALLARHLKVLIFMCVSSCRIYTVNTMHGTRENKQQLPVIPYPYSRQKAAAHHLQTLHRLL